MMIQSVWKNLTGPESQVLIPADTSGVTLNADLEPKIHHQTPNRLVHSLYGQKYWDTPFFRREKGTSKLW